jgi:hypothetical protein
MNNHLTPEEFARCFLGGATSTELQHIMRCLECSAELDRFGNTISLFRGGVRSRVEDRVASETPAISPLPVAHAGIRRLRLRWALVTAMAAVVVVPFLTRNEKKSVVIEDTSTQTDPNALMDSVNLHLARTIPAPMEPILALLPQDESTTESGGVQ